MDQRRPVPPPMDVRYEFRGIRFARFVDMDDFKAKVAPMLGSEISETMSLSELYGLVYSDHQPKKKAIDEILFENILYSDLNHIFLNKFSSPSEIRVEDYITRVKAIVEKNNHKPHIVPALHHIMNENGFYLMDALDITVPGAKFIAGHDFKVTNGIVTQARFLFTEAVPLKSGNIGYNLAGVHIDYINNIIMVLAQNVEDIVKYENSKEDDFAYDYSIAGIVKRVNDLIINQLGFTMKLDVEADRVGLFKFCKYLDEEMLKEIREMVRTRTNESLSQAADKLFHELYHNSENSPLPSEKQAFIDKTQASLIGGYINTNVRKSELRKRAKDLKLPGYPTRIDFTSTKSSRSSTESAGARNPISASDMFHSLYISFIQATSLQVFSISWFTDFKHLRPRNTEVIQTTIYASETRFRLVFKNHKPHGKDMLFHVIEHISKCRNY